MNPSLFWEGFLHNFPSVFFFQWMHFLLDIKNETFYVDLGFLRRWCIMQFIDCPGGGCRG